MIVVLLGGLGLIFGSFVNALVWRLHTKRDWVSERSQCPHCHHVLAPKDLIPVFSWLMLKGKCRYCAKKIEDSPIVELATGILFVGSYLCWPTALEGVGLYQFVFWLIFLVAFMALIVYDIRWFLLPNNIVYPITVLALVEVLSLPLLFHYGWQEVGAALLAAVVLSGTFYILFQLSKGEWIGGGDVKLAIALGLLAGNPLNSMLLLFFASLLGIICALPQLLKGKQKALKVRIPFGPFLIAGLIIVQLFGSSITAWYMQLLAV